MAPEASDGLRLLVDWPNPLQVFAGNLGDRLRGRVVPRQINTSRPDPGFWRDIDVHTPFPRRGILDSVGAHVALLGLLYAVSIWPTGTAHLESPLSRHSREGYSLSQYLPELHGSPSHSPAHGKAAPVLAKQEIRSLPENPDNLHQTIVTPPKIKLTKDVNLPNIVAYRPVPPLQPLAASARDVASLRLPALLPRAVGPAADTSALGERSRVAGFEARVVGAAPEITVANPRLILPAWQPRVAGPAADAGSAARGGNANLGQFTAQVAAPIPEMQEIGDQQRGSAQIIALNLHPAEVHGPVEIPAGNRSGAFAASPGGRADAPGTAGAEGSGAVGAGDSKGPANAPAGISVGAPAHWAAAVAAPNAPPSNGPLPNGPLAKAAPADPNLHAKFMAAMRPPPLGSVPAHQPIARESTAARSALENRIFAGRRSYTLSVNMPNLNTATGSWIIHFVERDPAGGHSPIAAPEVVSKFDPAYPGELMKDGVQGTVILTAIIRSDGSVGDIAVAKSLDSRLDRNAVEALSRWLFRPALKNGQAIDLEAVVTVPFRLKAVGLR
jgi:TonB family protein